ncbi:oligosaccharyl transferase glycoprotein complex, beta subunit [Exophiala dermatitidis]|uniref:Dolichyl-diphosphooligosaccharide--protein glycosyltransferase subunit WBP1 n=2 Tax=Exophiala dermatitidis TaxID=5970 RepID=H6BYK3_EXODN|nr:dolichyl-diphosphooligosaccharide-protein glycosyltransferase [Exophiala dermatitidis NIH/UT8656]KAJ4520228.1 oligosaccharyl transferase glycoprotein complex, beta subunit [Exophiala dermatitidis]EHY56716.1 dolichyl-diphosphooligosaccharide-protein glycosyltransferase [Exophiala dermatitidis NIH/UT8656]KAJ4524082.1 oligosaccharyl transferase glycoprotein complex, beta subunit [Exophiala dermatitidis]KAJ4525646.1 oligosaccharyl transferase glycoprotein complex, beta subunit [Exophiala dermati
MRLFSSLCLVVVALLSVVSARSAVGNRVLVVLEDESQKPLYSKFWADLEARDFKLSFESPRSEQLSLFRHGQLAYEHLLLTPPKSKGYGPSLTPKILLDYVNAGGNVLLGLSSDSGTPSAVSSLLLEFDISLSPDKHSVVVDHFNYDAVSAAEKHDVLLVDRPGPLRPDVVNFFGGDGVLAVPRAVGQTLGTSSALIAPILRAPKTAYTYNPKDETESVEEPFATGSQLDIISAMQARNSARVTVLGSLEMLQDKWFDASVKLPGGKSSKTVNQEFARQLTEWTFQEVGVLKVFSVQHYQITTSTKPTENTTQIGEYNPEMYRIKNDVKFSIEIGQYDRTHYVPFVVPETDALQLEFTMLSPFHRLPLSPTLTTDNSTIFSTTFTTPDQHGIFAFKVNYKRPFLTPIEERHQVTVRHFAHDEWPRSWEITGAWPWVAGLWSVIAGFVLFVLLWLYCEPPKEELERRRKLSVSVSSTK